MTEEHKTTSNVIEAQLPHNVLRAPGCLGEDEILAFAQGLCSQDSVQAIHVHVDACDTCQRLVNEAVHAIDATAVPASSGPTWNTTFQPNAIVARRYRILRLVARGGMGEVYEAHDEELQQRVAIKTVTSTACDNSRAVGYLKAEVQLARRVSHPNVCRIYDLGTHSAPVSGADIYFLVMEFVDGECLGKRLRQSGPLPFELAQAVALQLLQGLGAAHQAGILHRDFKSDNVVLRAESNGSVTPVILDFGLAKALNESGLISVTQHHGQSLVGTIGYMAPEQIEGEPLSTASDLYAFGVVWFEMLTGRLPFEDQTPAAAALARLYRQPTRPSTLNADVPLWLETLILKCLTRERSARFTTADEVIAALASSRCEAPPSSGRVTSVSSRLPLRSLMVATMVMPILVLLVWQSRRVVGDAPARTPRPPSIAEVTPPPSVQVHAPLSGETKPATVAVRQKTSRVRAGLRTSRARQTQPSAPEAANVSTAVPEPTTVPLAPSVEARTQGRVPDWLPLWSGTKSKAPTAVD